MENTELQKTENPSNLIELALKNNASIDTLERLMALQERWQASQAKREFNIALTAFQNECPEIIKFKEGYEGRYKFAPLSEIEQKIKTPMFKNGLSKRWEFEDIEGKDGKPKIKVICVIAHISGHSERTSMEADHDSSGSKNGIQARGSSLSYQQRYTLIGGLGLTTADVDSDGGKMTDLNIEDIRIKVASMETQAELKQYYNTLPKGWKDNSEVKTALKAQENFIKKAAEIAKKGEQNG